MKESPARPNLTHTIRDLIETDPDLSDSAIAAQFIATADQAMIVAAVANVVGTVRRSTVRRLERSAFDQPTRTDQVGEATNRVDARRALVIETFPLGDGRFVAWGEATIEDHEQRIGLLSAQKAGLTATIERHETAIALIRAADVKCLNDLEEWAA